MAQADRSKFLKNDVLFSNRGARYLVISLGYCGASTCLGNCVKVVIPEAVA